MVNIIKFSQFLNETEKNKEQEKKNKQNLKKFDEMKKLADQLYKYAHRWGENPSSRMMGWVDTYNENKHKMQHDGTWVEYCEWAGFSKSHNGYDCMA